MDREAALSPARGLVATSSVSPVTALISATSQKSQLRVALRDFWNAPRSPRPSSHGVVIRSEPPSPAFWLPRPPWPAGFLARSRAASPARRPAPLQYSVQNKILSPALPPSSDASFRAPNATGEMSSSLTFQTAAQPGSAAPVPEPWMAIPVSRWRRLLPASSLLPEIQHAARIDPAS